MNKLCIVIVMVQLMLGGYCCGRSDETSEGETKVEEEVTSLENKAAGEAKHVKSDIGLFEEDPKNLGNAMGKEEEKIPPPQEDWGHESESMGE
jgi:hypothetical protein